MIRIKEINLDPKIGKYMITYIEKRFKQIAEETGNAILEAQWEYDKQLVPDALKVISAIFPHFSTHDESHSICILNNVVNVLGRDAIDRFSCIDLWLLLEAAYCHDIGMVITADMIHDAFKDGSFPRYVEGIMSDSSHPLYPYSQMFEINAGNMSYKNETFIMQSFDAVKFLLSGYFRSSHAENSSVAIKEPKKRLSVDSPRVIIPSRLYSVLGDICLSHARDFEHVLELPFVENGLAIEKSHPRFLACLLRIGDLLDIDNNRFSETAFRTIGSIPYDSILHWEKHCSINHIRIDSKHIEVTAKCPNPQVAKLTNSWFDMIVEEFNNQVLRWNNIAPDEYGCYLPTLGDLKVEIDGYINFKSTEMPKFTINTEKALELLQGQRLYNTPFDSIREILQNAVDSTLIRFFLEKEGKQDFPDGINGAFLDQIKSYCINITTDFTESGDSIVTISDHGIGLKRAHLKYLSNTGSSSGNIEKVKIIKRMPDWLRPSGVFGIGFQSIFLVTDCVEILTKDFFTDDCYAMEMYKPSSSMKGEIYLKQCKHLNHFGLEIKFKLNQEILQKSTYNDPFKGIGYQDIFYMINKRIHDYAKMSVVPIKLNGRFIERRKFDYYDAETGIEIKLLSEDASMLNEQQEVYFKDARVINGGLSFRFLHPIINIHKESANDYLSLDRNSFTHEKEKYLENKVIKTLNNYIGQTQFNSHNFNPLDTISLAAYVKFYQESETNSVYRNSMLPNFSTINLNFDGGNIYTIDTICSAPKVIFRTVTSTSFIKCETGEDDTVSIEANILNIFTTPIMADIATMLFRILNDKYTNCYLKSVVHYQLFAGGEFVFTQDTKDIDTEISESYVDNRLFDITNRRAFIFYISGYEDLLIPPSVGIDDDIEFSTRYVSLPSEKVAKILSPFLKVNDLEKDARTPEFYNYVHRANGRPIKDIKASYDRFVNFCKAKGFVHLEEDKR